MYISKTIKIKYSCIFFFIRLSSVIVVQTFFVPDEYWQSLEVAHNLVFNYGYLTWEWQLGLRNCIYPLFISVFYKILHLLSCDTVFYLVYLPRTLQAITVAIGDYCTFCLCYRLYGSISAKWTAFFLSTSWFLFYCSPRTIINTTEMALTSIALSTYPWLSTSKYLKQTLYLWIASLTCIMRPTAAILWLPLFIWHWHRTHFHWSIIRKAILVGLLSLVFMLAIDSIYYGKFVFTIYNFFWYNWYKGIGSFYGKHSYHWYFTQGLPVTVALHLIPFALGVKRRNLWPMYLLVLWVVLILSFLDHKEFRFLLPVMPLIMCICGDSFKNLSKGSYISWMQYIFAVLIIIANIPCTIYFSIYHQSGVIHAIDFVRKEVIETVDINVLFLLPCHSTPYYSHIHSNISMRFLTCEPNLNDFDNYMDESDKFFQKPQVWLTKEILSKKLPSHIVMFDNIANSVQDLFPSYLNCFNAFHTHFPTGKIGRNIVVLCRNIA